jgi:5-methyltetrahydropteroyltriglutamate--homocysteine methyltransferase
MKRSSERILTTHVGSLPRPDDLIPLLQARDAGQAYDQAGLAARVARAVEEVARKQAGFGVDVINDGEHNKSVYSGYLWTRLGGFELRATRSPERPPTRDMLAFPAVYAERRLMSSVRPRKTSGGTSRPRMVCIGPVSYIGQKHVLADIENLKAALECCGAEEGFMTAISPTHPANSIPNEHYRTAEEYQVALADALREEYRAIVDAGLVLQVDDPLIANYYDHAPSATIDQCRTYIGSQVDLINYALRGIPEERVRFHTCYGVNIAPRVYDLELKYFVDLLLKINAGAYSIEAANPRHEHEWQVWQEVRLPERKVLIPGVVSHCIELVEHPELVAQRIVRFAGVLGRERVIASNDCGFGTASSGDQVHDDVAWAKLQSLAEGARLASKQLWGRSN